MRKIYFIRHSIRNQAIIDDATAPLTTTGHQLAKKLAGKFENVSVAAIYASPFLRAVQTVEPLAHQLHLPIITIPELRERQTQQRSDWLTHLQLLWHDFSQHDEDEESLAAVRERIVPAYQQILHDSTGDLVIASHGTALAVLFNDLTNGQFTFTDWQEMTMPDCYKATYEDNQLVTFQHIGMNYLTTTTKQD